MKKYLLKISGLIESALFLLALISVISLFARWHYLAENLTHFRIQYIICAGLALIYFALIKNKKWLIIATLTLAFNSFFILSAYQRDHSPALQKNKEIKLLFYNVLSSNQNYEEVLKYFQESDADILAVLELSHEWAKALEPLKKQYANHSIYPQNDNFGIALYTKGNGKITRTFLDPSVVPSLIYHEEDFTLLATHPIPPIGTQAYRNRNEHFENIAKLSQEHENFIAMGDFNCSVFSPFFKDMKKDGKLYSPKGFSAMKGTWSTNIALLITNLDHILVSENMEITEHKIAPHLGSDHWPIEATIRH